MDTCNSPTIRKVGPKIMHKIQLIALLFRLGFTIYKNVEEAIKLTTDLQLEFLKSAYTIFHCITGENEQAIENHLLAPRFCTLPDLNNYESIVTNVPKWNTNQITWSVINNIGNLNPVSVVACAAEAFKRWSNVSGIVPIYKPNDRTVMIVMDSRNIDGPYGVLGESQLPMGQPQSHQWYDSSEPWVISDNPSNNQIDLTRVMCHELGHALGMSHIGAGNLLAPIYSPQISHPQQGDIQEMQSRYGPPISTQPPIPVPPGPPTPTNEEIVIHLRGGSVTVDGYTLNKLGTSGVRSRRRRT